METFEETSRITNVSAIPQQCFLVCPGLYYIRKFSSEENGIEVECLWRVNQSTASRLPHSN
jgi:hypothetical protein